MLTSPSFLIAESAFPPKPLKLNSMCSTVEKSFHRPVNSTYPSLRSPTTTSHSPILSFISVAGPPLTRALTLVLSSYSSPPLLRIRPMSEPSLFPTLPTALHLPHSTTPPTLLLFTPSTTRKSEPTTPTLLLLLQQLEPSISPSSAAAHPPTPSNRHRSTIKVSPTQLPMESHQQLSTLQASISSPTLQSLA